MPCSRGIATPRLWHNDGRVVEASIVVDDSAALDMSIPITV
jgi:hypothetical protein